MTKNMKYTNDNKNKNKKKPLTEKKKYILMIFRQIHLKTHSKF